MDRWARLDRAAREALPDRVARQALWDRRGHRALPDRTEVRDRLEVRQAPQLTRPDRLALRHRQDPLDPLDRADR